MRVLLVEDDRGLAANVRQFLADNLISVDYAEDGERALSLLELNEYSVVVLDRNLPGINGDAVCRYILRTWPRTKTLMISGDVEIYDRIQGLQTGADDYITKPFDLDELVARIRALDRRHGDATTPILTGAGIRLNPDTKIVTRYDEPVALTAKEFVILQILMHSENSVISPDQLIERAWDENEDSSIGSLRVLINRLRKKLGDPIPITTVVGAGYRFDPDATRSSQPSPVADELSALLINARQQFVANVNHEIRAPLAFQSSMLDLISSKFSDNEELLEMLDQVRQSIRLQRRVLNGLIVIERCVFQAPEFTSVDIADIVDRILGSMNYSIVVRALTVRSEVEPDLWVVGDNPMLSVLLMNLLRNAVYHNVPDGWVEVALSSDNEYVDLEVRNGGNVVDPAVFEKAVARAQEIQDLALANFSSSGSGLPMIFLVADAHNAQLEWLAPESGGLEIRVRFPRALTRS